MDKYDRWTAITAITILLLAAIGLGLIGARELMADENFRAIALGVLAVIALVLIFVGAIVEMMAKDSPARATPPEGIVPGWFFYYPHAKISLTLWPRQPIKKKYL